jgi:hypothetical protein
MMRKKGKKRRRRRGIYTLFEGSRAHSHVLNRIAFEGYSKRYPA